MRKVLCIHPTMGFDQTRLPAGMAWKVMRLIAIFLFAASMQVCANGYTQNVSLQERNAKLEDLFQVLKKQTGLPVLYTRSMLKDSKRVTVNLKNVPLQQALNEILKDQGLDYSLVNNTIVIKVKEVVDPKDASTTLSTFLTTIDVSGRVTDAEGNPLAGASVKVKGTTAGTTTDANGVFVLKGIDENATLEISYAEYETVVVKVNKRSSINVELKQEIGKVGEIIIKKGYYDVKQRENTGNVSKVKGEEIRQQPVSNVLFALEGKVPGLFISQISGTPGSSATVRLRGQNSIDNGKEPLYIIDGVPFASSTSTLSQIYLAGVGSSPLNAINPNDIESVEVLKDADATAIYGSRGANGVILITTRNGKAGKTRVDVNFYQGFGKVTREMDLLNTQQYLQMRHEAFQNDGALPSASAYDINGKWDSTRYTNWQKVFLGNTASNTNAEISVSGGNNNIKYIIGGSYRNESTIMPGDFFARNASAHFNLNGNSNDQKFNFSFTGNYVNGKRVMPASDLTTNILLAPNAPKIYNNDGSLNWGDFKSVNNALTFTWAWQNPFGKLKQVAKDYTNNLISSFSAGYKILPGLEIKASLNYNDYRLNESSIVPLSSWIPLVTDPSRRENYVSTSEIKTWNFEPQINYNKSFGKSQISFLLGSTFLQTNTTVLSVGGYGFSSDDLIENLAAASTVYIGTNRISNYKYNAFFGRLGYNLDGKYLINLTARRDGSSRFGPATRFGNFGAAGVGWIFSKENFIARNLKFLSFGKLRASYGTSGNDQIGDYAFMPTYSSYSFTYQGLAGLIPSGLPNPHYGWEEQRKLEGGIELGIISDRILVNADYYRNRTVNQLVNYPLASLTGGSSIKANLPAVIENKGFEFELNTVNLKSKNLTWRSSFNISFPKNKLVSFPGIEKSSYATRYQVGKSLFVQGLFHSLGVDPLTGLYKIQDINNDGLFTSPQDLTFPEIKQKYFGGFSNTLTFKNFQLDFTLYFVKQTGYNYLRLFSMPGAFGANANQPTLVLNRWQKPGDVSQVQKFSQNFSSAAWTQYSRTAFSSDAQISDASYLRLRNVNLSYQLPASWKNKMHIQNARIYLLGQNLFTITNYLGLDPETQAILPPLRTIVFGIQLTF
jgi:TonB-dependent starch-binding outer membrane protein SusC